MGPFATRPAAENRIAELRRQGLKELAIADAPKGQFAISFGNFSAEAAAVAYTEELARVGINSRRSSGAASRCRRRWSSCAIRSNRWWLACASSRRGIRGASCGTAACERAT